MKNIGFIGIGVMGASMVRNLLKNGYNVSVYNRTKAKAEALKSDGAAVCDSIKECVQDKDAIITMIGYPKDLEEVYFSDYGIIANAPKHAYLIDMTTSSPKLAEQIYAKAKEKDLQALDAPVSGGDIGAKNATLAIMVGGDEDAFKACHPIFEAMGKNIVYEGKAGAGQHVKMANQIVVAANTTGVCEAISYCLAMGIDPKIMLKTIETGAAASWQVSNNGPKMCNEDFAPGFFIKHFVKDMKIALEECQDKNIRLPILEKVFSMYQEMENNNQGDLGTQAIIKKYTK